MIERSICKRLSVPKAIKTACVRAGRDELKLALQTRHSETGMSLLTVSFAMPDPEEGLADGGKSGSKLRALHSAARELQPVWPRPSWINRIGHFLPEYQ
jgi:hypothetical protein